MLAPAVPDRCTSDIYNVGTHEEVYTMINPLGPRRRYIRARCTTIGGYIRTLTMNAPLTGYRGATPTTLLSTHTITTQSMADDVEMQAASQVLCG